MIQYIYRLLPIGQGFTQNETHPPEHNVFYAQVNNNASECQVKTYAKKTTNKTRNKNQPGATKQAKESKAKRKQASTIIVKATRQPEPTTSRHARETKHTTVRSALACTTTLTTATPSGHPWPQRRHGVDWQATHITQLYGGVCDFYVRLSRIKPDGSVDHFTAHGTRLADLVVAAFLATNLVSAGHEGHLKRKGAVSYAENGNGQSVTHPQTR